MYLSWYFSSEILGVPMPQAILECLLSFSSPTPGASTFKAQLKIQLSTSDAPEILQDLLYQVFGPMCTSTVCWVTFLSYPYVSLLMACLYCFESLHHHEPGKGLNKYCWLIEAMIKHEQYLILKNTHLRIFHIPFPPYSPIANWEARWINTKISEPRNQFNFTVSKHGNPPSSTHGSCYVCKWEGSAVKIQPLE